MPLRFMLLSSQPSTRSWRASCLSAFARTRSSRSAMRLERPGRLLLPLERPARLRLRVLEARALEVLRHVADRAARDLLDLRRRLVDADYDQSGAARLEHRRHALGLVALHAVRHVPDPRAHARPSAGHRDRDRRGEEDRDAGARSRADPARVLRRLLVLVHLDLAALVLREDGRVVRADLALVVELLDRVVVALGFGHGLVYACEEEHLLAHEGSCRPESPPTLDQRRGARITRNG